MENICNGEGTKPLLFMMGTYETPESSRTRNPIDQPNPLETPKLSALLRNAALSFSPSRHGQILRPRPTRATCLAPSWRLASVSSNAPSSTRRSKVPMPCSTVKPFAASARIAASGSASGFERLRGFGFSASLGDSRRLLGVRGSVRDQRRGGCKTPPELKGGAHVSLAFVVSFPSLTRGGVQCTNPFFNGVGISTE